MELQAQRDIKKIGKRLQGVVDELQVEYPNAHMITAVILDDDLAGAPSVVNMAGRQVELATLITNQIANFCERTEVSPYRMLGWIKEALELAEQEQSRVSESALDPTNFDKLSFEKKLKVMAEVEKIMTDALEEG